ncbi:MAG: rRNA maturation RNase YbeY [Alphaproteobacteria bacterium]
MLLDSLPLLLEQALAMGWPDKQEQPACVHIEIVLADDELLHQLNHEYRGKDKPTNVLSFPQYPAFGPFTPQPDGQVMLGSLVLSLTRLLEEAKEQQKLPEHHVKHLFIHGALHLLGYDHETDEEAAIMEGLEKEILQPMGINCYE